jgi:ABC-2 type transport system ATP-binding protein
MTSAPAPPAVLTVSNLNKSFGKVKAVQNLSLSVPEGSVYGLLGPNGSGKSTTLSILLGILNADQGNFQWFNQDDHRAARQQIGALLEKPNFYPYLSAKDNLEVVRRIKSGDPARIEEVLERVGLLHRKDSAFKTFSTGMKQRLAIASALLINPDVLVLDEPTNGLDPQGIADIRDLISRIAAEGKTIILASHILDEVEKVCTHVAVIKYGVKLAEGHVSEILAEKPSIELAAEDQQALEKALANFDGITINRAEGKRLIGTIEEHIPAAELNAHLHNQGVSLNHLVVRKKSLEETFLELTSESN